MTWAARPGINAGFYVDGPDLEEMLDRIQALSNAENVNALAVTAGSNTTTSASYANLAGTGSQTSVTITKLQAASKLKITLCATLTGAVSTVDFGVLIGATDYDIARIQVDVAGHCTATAVRRISGLAPGAYTVQGRWKRAGGAGTPTRDVNDWFSLDVEEVG